VSEDSRYASLTKVKPDFSLDIDILTGFHILIGVLFFIISPMERKFTIDIQSSIIAAWVLFVSLYFLCSIAYPYIATKSMDAAYQNGRAAGTQETYNAAMASFSGNVFQNGYSTAFGQLGQALATQVKEGCKSAIPVTVASGTTIEILNTGCLASGTGETQKK
jgi:hypothetical protein